MKLYHMPGTRSSRVLWTALELGVELELEVVNLSQGEGRSDAHLRRHPHGKLPAAEVQGTSLIESGALALHLALRHGAKAPFLPDLGTMEGAKVLQWAFYAAASIDDVTIDAFLHKFLLPEKVRDQAVIDKGSKLWSTTVHPFLASELKGPYLMGDAFSFADIMVGYPAYFANKLGWLEGGLKDYVERLAQRPAFQRAFAQ